MQTVQKSLTPSLAILRPCLAKDGVKDSWYACILFDSQLTRRAATLANASGVSGLLLRQGTVHTPPRPSALMLRLQLAFSTTIYSLLPPLTSVGTVEQLHTDCSYKLSANATYSLVVGIQGGPYQHNDKLHAQMQYENTQAQPFNRVA